MAGTSGRSGRLRVGVGPGLVATLGSLLLVSFVFGRFNILDHGAMMRQVIERFHRVRGARRRTFEGTGIGLALVRELIKLHGGQVSVASSHGQGTTFTVRLPLGTAHLPADRIRADRELVSTASGAAPFVEEALRWLPDEEKASTVRREAEAMRRLADEHLRTVHQAEALRLSNEDLTRLNRTMVGRELRMIELKQEINDLGVQAGLPPRYAPDAREGQE